MHTQHNTSNISFVDDKTCVVTFKNNNNNKNNNTGVEYQLHK